MEQGRRRRTRPKPCATTARPSATLPRRIRGAQGRPVLQGDTLAGGFGDYERDTEPPADPAHVAKAVRRVVVDQADRPASASSRSSARRTGSRGASAPSTSRRTPCVCAGSSASVRKRFTFGVPPTNDQSELDRLVLLEPHLRVRDRRLDLQTVADDSLVGESTLGVQPRHLRRVESRERARGSPRACAGSSTRRDRPAHPRATSISNRCDRRATARPTPRRDTRRRADRPRGPRPQRSSSRAAWPSRGSRAPRRGRRPRRPPRARPRAASGPRRPPP